MEPDAIKRVDLEALASFLETEKGGDSIKPLPQNFWNAFDAYYKKLQQDYLECANRSEREQLYDEMRGAKILYESLIDRRVSKLIGYACIGSRPNSALPEELTFYDEFRELISRYKEQYLAVVHQF